MTKDEIITFISNRTKINHIKNAVVAKEGRDGSFTTFESSLKNNETYVLLLRNINKTDSGYEYDTSEYKIVKINPDINISQLKMYNDSLYWITPSEYSIIYDPLDNSMSQNFTTFTKKEMACILLKVPDTNHEWLNQLIKKSLQ